MKSLERVTLCVVACAIVTQMGFVRIAAGASVAQAITVPIPVSPLTVAIAPGGHLAFATDDTNAITVVDLLTHLTTSVQLSVGQLTDVAVSPNGSFAYVTSNCSGNPCAKTLSVLSILTDHVTGSIALGESASLVTFNSAGNLAFVAGNGYIYVVNTKTQKVESRIQVTDGIFPQFLGSSPNGHTVFLATTDGTGAKSNAQDERLDFIDVAKGRQIASLDQGTSSQPCGMGVLPNGDAIYETFCTGRNGADADRVINTQTHRVVATLASPEGQRGVVLSSSGRLAYVGDDATGEVEVIDTATNRFAGFINTPRIPETLGYAVPEPIAISNDGNTIYTNDFSLFAPKGTIGIIRLTGSVASTPAPAPPERIPQELKLYLNASTTLRDGLRSGSVQESYTDVGDGLTLRAKDEVGASQGLQRVSIGAMRAETLVIDNTAYIEGNRSAISGFFNIKKPKPASLANKWIRIPHNDPSYSTESSEATLASDLDSLHIKGVVEVGSSQVVDGQKCTQYNFRSTSKSGVVTTFTLFATQSATPLPLRLVEVSNGETQTWNWSNWGRSMSLTAPPSSISIPPGTAS